MRLKIVCCFVLLLVAACARVPSDAELVAQDKQVLADFQTIQTKFNAGQISKSEFKRGLQTLQGREAKVFDEARRHHFTDAAAGNYFYRMRLKFPSPIYETLQDIQ